jgi:hypothetical protein
MTELQLSKLFEAEDAVSLKALRLCAESKLLRQRARECVGEFGIWRDGGGTAWRPVKPATVWGYE